MPIEIIILIGVVSGILIGLINNHIFYKEKSKVYKLIILSLGSVSGCVEAVLTSFFKKTDPTIFGLHLLPSIVGGMLFPYEIYWLLKK